MDRALIARIGALSQVVIDVAKERPRAEVAEALADWVADEVTAIAEEQHAAGRALAESLAGTSVVYSVPR